jgi:hypothetical protein
MLGDAYVIVYSLCFFETSATILLRPDTRSMSATILLRPNTRYMSAIILLRPNTKSMSATILLRPNTRYQVYECDHPPSS